MSRGLARVLFQPASSAWWSEPFIKVPLIYLLIAGGYIAASSYYFAARLDYSSGALRAELIKGMAFVLITGSILAWLMFRSHQRTQASWESFHDLVQSLPDAVLVVAIPDRRIVFANAACADIFGYESGELIGQRTEQLHLDRQHFEEFNELSSRTLEQGQAFLGEFRMRRRDGSEFPSSHVVTYLKNTGSPEFVVSVVRDETAHREQRRQIEESAERLRLIGENLREVFWIEDAGSGRLEFVSQAFEEVWGRPVSEAAENPSTILEHVHPSDRAQVSRAFAHAGNGYDIQYRMIRPDGETRWIHGRAVPVRGDIGGTERIVGLSADVTQLVEQQEELRLAQKLQAVGELTGGVAHDFNNLLMVMMGNAEDVADRLQRKGIEEQGLEEIIAAAHRARDLTESLLRFSRRQTSASGRLDVNEAVRRTSLSLDRVLGTQVRVTTSLTDEECVVSANPTEFETCLINLLVNARDAMPGGGTVEVSTRTEHVGAGGSEIAEGRYVVLAVADTGQGMSDTVRRRALEPFFTTKDAGSGTGLGLSLVNSFSKAAGGTVRIFSRPEQGTTLEMHLPCWPEPAADGDDLPGYPERPLTR